MNLAFKDAIPFSPDYDDFYFSKQGGLDETRHVFLEGNNLAQRFPQTDFDFAIGELGFGTGLNFLAAWQLWQQTAPEGAFLKFVSVEKSPISPADIAKTLTNWPELSELTNQFLEKYTEAPTQNTSYLFADGLVSLTILVGDVMTVLPKKDFKADAWFLDGFSPEKNPAMWSEEVMQEVARLTKPNGTFATYTVARAVKDALKNADFQLEKRPGFGHKREMLVGHQNNKT
jgi:tRNA 5-methylaminomethyl-2-thiouridine biosynthesis bifunctional protein